MALKPCKECGQQISTEAKTCPHCGKANPTGKLSFAQIGCLSIIVLWLIGRITAGNLDTPTTTSTPTSSSFTSSAPAPDPKASVRNALKVDFSWSKGGFESVMMVNFVFTNASSHPVKDIEVRCDHYAPSGTVIDHNTRTVYEVVPAHGKKRVRDFNMGFIHSQVSSSSCAIEDFELAD
jgi:hypothetical protein